MSLSAPELRELHNNMLDYLTKRSRIMSAHRLSVWNDFAAYYNYQYSDYSREELRKEFLMTILPKVFSYNLTHIQKRKVEIFASHHRFTRNADGFCELGGTTLNLPIEGVHYVRNETDAQFSKVACVLLESDNRRPYPDLKVCAWTSAITSSDAELVRYCLYRGTELCKKVTETRKQFHQTGKLPENMNPAIVKKIIGFRNIAEKLSSKLVATFS